jgi:hypothetical protein
MAEYRRSVPPPNPPTVPLTFPLRVPRTFPRAPSPPTIGRISNPLELGRCLIQSPCSPKYWLLIVLVEDHADQEGQRCLRQEGAGLRIGGEIEGLAGHHAKCTSPGSPNRTPARSSTDQLVLSRSDGDRVHANRAHQPGLCSPLSPWHLAWSRASRLVPMEVPCRLSAVGAGTRGGATEAARRWASLPREQRR